MIQHVKLNTILESSLQSIDKSVTLPYWDFTIDQAEGLAIYESVIFSDELFGRMSLPANVTLGNFLF